MRQKIDITEIESKTKIRAKYLRAMENEEFDLLPGSTFAKSFLRTYADALGLDSHRLVEEYRSQYEPRDESDLPPLSSQPGARSRRGRYERRPPPPLPPVSPRTARIPSTATAITMITVPGPGGPREGRGRRRSARRLGLDTIGWSSFSPRGS